MGHCEGDDLGHGGMIQKNFVSFAQADLSPATIDDFFNRPVRVR
jgi:hypothetical protein